MTTPRHLLVMRFSAMGDVAMTVPVVKALLNQYPDLTVTFVSRPGFSSFFCDIPRLNYFAVDFNSEHKGLPGLLRLYSQLKSKATYHVVANLHNNLRSNVLGSLFKLSGIKVKTVNKGREEKKLLTRFPGKVLKPLKRTTQRYADVFAELGFPVELDYQLKGGASILTDEIKQITGEKEQAWIGITPFAQHIGKTYPEEKMAQVLQLLQQYKVKVFLFGGTPRDKQICEMWEQTFASVTSTVHKLNMQQELKLITNLNVMLSMDSAGMHLASLQGVPAVSVWGATHHFAGFLGYGQSEENIVADDIACRPCSVYGNKPCFRKDYACLHNITPDVIANKLLKFV
ncbi:glycosyltransferase family 9 protein [Mucilaginibacter calamicampi]|uniref:Glycosyltransferase family 9 protein n=1 Tax=Mucilaginibacter calamicampi TaxID=1302352 RepID=A0ABW2YUR0_9SPHI